MIVQREEFKKRPVIAFYEEASSKYPLLRFGLRKAMVILENFESICNFVRDNKDKLPKEGEEKSDE